MSISPRFFCYWGDDEYIYPQVTNEPRRNRHQWFCILLTSSSSFFLSAPHLILLLKRSGKQQKRASVKFSFNLGSIESGSVKPGVTKLWFITNTNIKFMRITQRVYVWKCTKNLYKMRCTKNSCLKIIGATLIDTKIWNLPLKRLVHNELPRICVDTKLVHWNYVE